MSQVRVAFTIHGTVQGVNFRSFTQKQAGSLGLTGWVKNTNDDKVTGEAQGSEEAIGKFRKELNSGPRHARVVKVEMNKQAETKADESSFAIK